MMVNDMSTQNTSKPCVIVGLSGGVDSSVAAFLLQQQGYHVEGVFMKNWEEENEPLLTQHCSADQDLTDARLICYKLGIRLHTVNFSQEYWDRVFTYFLEEYKAGRTPNPDILCNKEIKFDAFLDHAIKELSADFIATGHYARQSYSETHHQYQLLKGVDLQKDQTYFLYALNQSQLAKTLFPIGHLTKPIIRSIAEKLGFANYNKKGSTGICFIGERKFKQFLSQYLPAQPGLIETVDGKAIGHHDGLMYYTIGQRQGLGIGGLKNSTEMPWYVVQKDLKRNVLIVGQGHDHPRLFSKQLSATQLHWISTEIPTTPFHCQAKIRYRQTDQPCTIESIDNNTAHIAFEQAQRAITPGQSIVFYEGERCLGGGIIDAGSE